MLVSLLPLPPNQWDDVAVANVKSTISKNNEGEFTPRRKSLSVWYLALLLAYTPLALYSLGAVPPELDGCAMYFLYFE